MKIDVGRKQYLILIEVRHVNPLTLTGRDLTLLILAMLRKAIDRLNLPVFF